MTLKSPIQFPIFAPAKSPFHHRPATTEVRFSRWNNANAEKFNRDRRTQKEIEDQFRYQKRFDSAHNIAYNYNPAPPTPTFKSTGTPSSPSRPSIPGKKSKYSKVETPESSSRHPAFKPIIRKRKIPKINGDDEEEDEDFPSDEEALKKPVASVRIEEKGVCYEFPDAPFLYQYSYTETPKAKPQGIREPLVAPFEPGTMGRPWTGRKPLPPSKKKLREFDSFRLPPPGKKGVKPVQAPGPYLAGTGPRHVKSREEVLGEPLTPEEVKTLVESASKCTRQLNIGRDGLTHNMLENIHALWKRRRVCKIKCKGVCTVDMDNVRQQLEEKTGGKIIFSRGGVVFLFRGRNYNDKNRPRFPLMLWKPASPVYPRLIKRVPEGLTLEEATEMRKTGRDLTPICKLGKNGVYSDLVKNVREAFEECELVRINCQGLNGSDYRKIGAKLKDLVPCVLISFEHEHLLMWRGRDWQSSLPELKNDANGVRELNTDTAAVGPKLEGRAQSVTASAASTPDMLVSYTSEIQNTSTSSFDNEDVESEESREYGEEEIEELMPSISSESIAAIQDIYDSEKPPSPVDPILGSEPLIEINRSKKANDGYESEKDLDGPSVDHYDLENILSGSEARPGSSRGNDKHTEPSSLVLQDVPEKTMYTGVLPVSISPEAEGVLLLRKEAVESGSAIVLDSSSLDADVVYERAVALAQSAPLGPVFRRRSKKLVNKEPEEQQSDNLVSREEAAKVPEEEVRAPSRKGSNKSPKNRSMKDIRGDYLNVVPRGSLGVDELAKLLS